MAGVALGLRALLLRAAESPRLRRVVTGRAVTRRIAERFVAGETLDEGVAVAAWLARQRPAADSRRPAAGGGRSAAVVGRAEVTLDYLGEDVTTAPEARAARDVVLATLQRLAAAGLPGGVSVKPTQMGLRLDPELCRELLAEIAAAAGRIGAHVTLDMEGSDVTEATVGLVERLQADGHRAVGCALQAYLHRTGDDVRRLTAAGASLRLCKGAYAEPADVAYQSRAKVDANFAACADWLLEHGVHPRLATHDQRLIARAQRTAARLGRDRAAFEFQMLYGVRPRLQEALLRDGWRLCVYVPFGDQWYPYFMRRLAERPANVAFFLRALRG